MQLQEVSVQTEQVATVLATAPALAHWYSGAMSDHTLCTGGSDSLSSAGVCGA